MISDDPDEDADMLDDGAMFDKYLGDAPPRRDSAASDATTLPDWPEAMRDIGLDLDTETLSWFKAANTNWRSAMRSVLRAWVVANTAERQTKIQAVAIVEAGQPEDRP
jgi:uncharacterized protein (DUF4415 family)